MSVESCESIFTDGSQSEDSVTESSIVETVDLQVSVVESFSMEDFDPITNVLELQQPLPGLMKYGAACSNSNISFITFGPSHIKFKLHTLETIALPMNNQYFNDITKLAAATGALDLAFAKCAPGVYNAAAWEQLNQGTASVTLSETWVNPCPRKL